MSGPTGLAFAYRNKFEEEKVKPVRIIGKSMPEYKDVLGVIKSYKIQGRVLYKWEDVLLAVKEVRTLKYKR